MLELDIPSGELYNEATKRFVPYSGVHLTLEHSLVTISAWEEIHKKPFLDDKPKTEEEMLDYIRCMDQDPKSLDVYQRLSMDHIHTIQQYIQDPHTASSVHDLRKNTGRKQTITSEVIYYWMIVRNIPIEFQHWHLNRLLMLIRIFDAEQGAAGGKNGKMSRAEAAAWQRQQNAQRLAAMKNKG